MKAVVYDTYGPPDVLRLEEVARPVSKEDEVLVEVHATTVNRSDVHTREANRSNGLAISVLARMVSGVRRPRQRILGREFAYLPTDGFENIFLALWPSRKEDKRVVFQIPPRQPKQDVVFLKQLVEAGKFRPVIDRRYPLEDVIEATRYVETEQKTGNVVLTVDGAR
jgi:NADPH:quinone reductase-like Zn-dependent oxidoreductase